MRENRTNWQVWGPIVFATLLFVIATAIKALAFNRTSFVLDVGSEFALWATGVLFSLAVANQSLMAGRTELVFTKKETGAGIEIDYIARPPDELDFSPRYLYLFVYSMMIWIITILVTEKAHLLYGASGTHTYTTISLTFVSSVLAATSVGCAIRGLKEAT